MKPSLLQTVPPRSDNRLARLWRWLASPHAPSVVEVEFAKPHALRLHGDAWITCLAGTAWLTRDGCPADTVLSPGAVQRVSRADRALVVGMPRCNLKISGAPGGHGETR